MDEQHMIVIATKEYKELLEVSVRVSIFSDYVKREKYSIGRKDCARYLGFEIDDGED